MNIESTKQAWIGGAGQSDEPNSIHARQSIRRVRIRIVAGMMSGLFALLAVAAGIILVSSSGVDMLEIFAWSLIAASLLTLIIQIVQVHGRVQARFLPVLDHVEAGLTRTTRLKALIEKQQRLFWAPMLIAFVLLAIASDYQHWTDYTFAITSIGVVVWGLVYGRDCVLAYIEEDRQALSEQASMLRRLEIEENAQ